MTIEATSIVERRTDVMFSRLDDDLLALDPQAGCCYSLNGPAARIWELIDSPTPVSILCDRLIDEYDVNRATCLGDVIELIDELRGAELVRVGQTQP
jgi:Coenzyme PQQ synthesis protein D (PqqD)